MTIDRETARELARKRPPVSGLLSFNVGRLMPTVLTTHDDGRIALDLQSGDVMLTLRGTPQELHAFAHRIDRATERAAGTR